MFVGTPAFAELVGLDQSRLAGLARPFVSNPLAAEDGAQDSWLAVLGRVEHFEGRSSL